MACSCQRGSHVGQLIVFISMELITYISGVLLLPGMVPDWKYWRIIIGLSAVVRIVGFFLVSWWLTPRWWGRYRRLDTLVPSIIVTALSFAFLTLKPLVDAKLPVPAEVIINVALAGPLHWTNAGALRTILKYYNWNIRTITAFKLWRFMGLIAVVAYQNLATDSSGPAIAFFGSVLSLVSGYLSKTVDRADEVRDQLKKAPKTEDQTLLLNSLT